MVNLLRRQHDCHVRMMMSTNDVIRAKTLVPEEQRIAWVICNPNNIPKVAPEPNTSAPSVAIAMPVVINSVLVLS
jgi:hypothetical protein